MPLSLSPTALLSHRALQRERPAFAGLSQNVYGCSGFAVAATFRSAAGFEPATFGL